jgi:protein-S-isoprenylcysteine O-methyltransferase Ste14
MAAMTSGRQRDVGPWNHIRAIALLPFMNVIVIPTLIVGASGGFAAPQISGAEPAIFLTRTFAMLPLLSGIVLVARCIGLFVRRGNGTLAPWDPTRRLITEGPYRYVRNPMKSGLFLILIGECLLLPSIGLVVWTAAFMAANGIYIRLSEEPGLRARFRESYDDYCATVPRWWPRLAARRRSAVNGGDLA